MPLTQGDIPSLVWEIVNSLSASNGSSSLQSEPLDSSPPDMNRAGHSDTSSSESTHQPGQTTRPGMFARVYSLCYKLVLLVAAWLISARQNVTILVLYTMYTLINYNAYRFASCITNVYPLHCLVPYPLLSCWNVRQLGETTLPSTEMSTGNMTEAHATVGARLPPVPARLVAKIEAGDFVDMAELLPDRWGITKSSASDTGMVPLKCNTAYSHDFVLSKRIVLSECWIVE